MTNPRMVNPYIAGAPVSEARMFFGREDVFDWIQNNLTGRYADHILVIHGQRRVGKTSVLKQLGNRLPEKYIPVFFDLQGHTHTSLDRFYWWVGREIVRVLKQSYSFDLAAPEKAVFAADPDYFETQFLAEIRSKIGERNLLLTFDEFDNLEESEKDEGTVRLLIDSLRKLLGQEGLNFIFSIGSSGRKLEHMQVTYTDFFKTALYKKIDFLTREQTANLVIRPVEGLVEYGSQAVERIYTITSGHPYFSQLICHELFSRCQQTGETHIGLANVESILEDVVERGTVNLKYTWDEASVLERWALTSLANQDNAPDNPTLAEFLKKQKVRFSESSLNAAILHLREKDILTPENRFVVHLLRIWLQKNHSLEQVHQELIEINPIVDRYIEIGQEYQDRGLYDKAIENYRQALVIAPEEIRALTGIGLSQLARQAPELALPELFSALALDEDHVAARVGLCEAYLKLGDAARAKGKTKEAVQFYQKILAVNSEHSDGRARLADLQRLQAEKALADGRDEDALEALREALKFTPADETLQARYDRIAEDLRSKNLAALLVRADKERAVRNWKAAFDTLEAARKLAPENEVIQQKIEIFGQQSLREKIEETRARAQLLSRQERYPEAIQAWEELKKLTPQEDQAIQTEIDRLVQRQGLSVAYTKAQDALNNKDYSQAIAFYKEIIVQDENFRDTTRRMAEAVQLRSARRRIWQSRWFILAPVSLVIVASALLLVFFPPNFLKHTAGTLVQMTTPETPAASQPSAASLPTAAPVALDPDQPHWELLSGSANFLPALVSAMAIDPDHPDTVLAGTIGAGIYLTQDGGRSWKPSNTGLGNGAVKQLVLDPHHAGIIYAVLLKQGGLYKSVDSGASWKEINKGLLPYLASSSGGTLYVHPDNTQWLHFADAGLGFYQSLDGGENWQSVKKGACPYITRFAGDPQDGKHLVALATHDQKCDSGLYKSTDGGITWGLQASTDIGIDALDDISAWSLAADPFNFDTFYVSGPKEALWKSADAGKTWQQLNSSGCNWLAVPSMPGAVICGSDRVIQLSSDGGETWLSYTGIVTTSSGQNFAVTPNNSMTFYAGTLGVMKSVNGGISWTPTGLLGAGEIQLRVDPANGGRLYAGGREPGCQAQRSGDNGMTWQVIAADRVDCPGVVDPSKNLLYQLTYTNIARSKNMGQDWETDSSTLISPLRLVINPAKPAKLYIAEQCTRRLLQSEDGKTFHEMGPFPGPICDIEEVVISQDGQWIYVITGGTIMRSKDGGDTWEQAADLGSQIVTAVIDPLDPNVLYVGSVQRGVFKLNDNVLDEISNGLSSAVINELAIDPVNPEVLYAATDGGFFLSEDGGSSWQPLQTGLGPNPIVYSIAIDPNKTSRIFAATPDGIYRLVGR